MKKTFKSRGLAEEFSRRHFVRGAAAVGASLPFVGLRHTPASARAMPELDLYVAIWPSLTGLVLPWETDSPRHLAERFCYMLWSYVQSHSNRLEAAFSAMHRKTSAIGHASLYAELRRADGRTENVLFSNTGGDPGFYENPGSLMPPLGLPSRRFPKRYRFLNNFWKAGFMACFFVDELLAGHVSDGKWESVDEYAGRLDNDLMRVRKYNASGDVAVEVFERLRAIRRATKLGGFVGGPMHFGLNTTFVREVRNFGQPLSMHRYPAANKWYEIHGGCANAVASVLVASDLPSLVPDRARFSMEVNLGRFAGVSVPLVTRSREYRNGRPANEDLIVELNRVPNSWGRGDQISFVDPNYWYRTFPNDTRLIDSFRNRIRRRRGVGHSSSVGSSYWK